MPALDLKQIRKLVDTVVLVMMENRSFDHMLGHLSYRQFDTGLQVDGLRDPLDQPAYENPYATQPYYPFTMRDGILPSDLPHEREEVAKQLAFSRTSGRHTMRGFVEAYYQHTTVNWTRTPEPLGFYPPNEVPITSFLASNFAVCDRFFSALPTSTLPNRLMAWTGSAHVDHTGSVLPPRDDTLLDWLDAHDVRWRVYHDGLSFFTLLGAFKHVLSKNFKRFEHLALDVLSESDDTFPQVIIIEPSYGDAPHLGTDKPNDNHAPLPVAPGEHFQRLIYRALTANPGRWAKTMMVVYYDEHGGFYDHVPPLNIPYDPRPAAEYPAFTTTGVRVPGIIVSPLVASRTVYKEPLDHTSILQFLAQLFAPRSRGYNDVVNRRRDAGITSIGDVLNLATPRVATPRVPDVAIQSVEVLGDAHPLKSPQQKLFELAANEMVTTHKQKTKTQYPELWHWAIERDGANG